MRAFTYVGSSLVLLGLLGCAGSHRAWTTADSWYHATQDTSRFWQADRLPDADVMQVAPDKMAEAQKQLREAACVGLSSQRASELVGQRVESVSGKRLFLVRGVYLNRGTGRFMVVPVGSELMVEHGSLGHSPVPMKRQALIVRLSQKPETVYVTCSMDE